MPIVSANFKKQCYVTIAITQIRKFFFYEELCRISCVGQILPDYPYYNPIMSPSLAVSVSVSIKNPIAKEIV